MNKCIDENRKKLVGSNIKHLMKENGDKAFNLAKSINVSVGTLYRYTGGHGSSEDIMMAIAMHYGVAYEEFTTKDLRNENVVGINKKINLKTGVEVSSE